MTNRYQSIVFIQGDDANEPIDLLYNWQGDKHHCHYLGVTQESVAAALEYMRQWDYGEPAEETDTPSGGSSDDTWAEGEYILTAHLGLGYIGLERIITLPVESYRCPCCGDDVMDSRPICEDCREASCEATVDASGDLGYWECQQDSEWIWS